MNKANYQGLIEGIVNQLEPRKKEIITRRFGLEKNERETLESIGKSFHICRERVRQIEAKTIKEILEKNPSLEKIFVSLLSYFKEYGYLRKEETALAELSDNENKNFVFFLLSLKKDYFQRINENKDFFTFWTTNTKIIPKAKEIIEKLIKKFNKEKKPLVLGEINKLFNLPEKVLSSYLEISKIIMKNKNGLYGLKHWSIINPRRIRDRIYFLMKEIKEPLHFKKIHELMPTTNINSIHNELIKDNRFVLVGRGIYALREWGYIPGNLKELIIKYMKEKRRPLLKEEIIDFVSKQRFVKKFTVLQYLCDRMLFEKRNDGRYYVKEA